MVDEQNDKQNDRDRDAVDALLDGLHAPVTPQPKPQPTPEHDYYFCWLADCQRCGDYADGYTDSALDAREWKLGEHSPDRSIVLDVIDAQSLTQPSEQSLVAT